MRIRILSLLLIGAVFVAQSPLAQAQGSSRDWSAVQAIAIDERLVVKQKDGKTIEGKMIEASETNLTLSRNNTVVNISRNNIQQIQHSTGKAAKAKWALIGTGIGAGAGVGIGAAKYSPARDDSEMWIPIGFFFGTAAGAVTGVLFGASQRRRTVIYQSP